MKSLRFLLSVILVSLSTGAFAQSDGQKAAGTPVLSESAEVLHNHQEPGGRVGRSCHCAGHAADIRR